MSTDGAVENQRRDARRRRPVDRSREKSVFAGELDRVAQVHAELARGPRAAALRRHGGVEARLVDREAALARHVGGQIERKAVGVVQPEHRLARDHG